MDFSVVIPVYGCRKAIPELYQRLTDTLSKLSPEYEIILVNDNCPQNSWEEIEKICELDQRVVGIETGALHRGRNRVHKFEIRCTILPYAMPPPLLSW